MVWRVYRVENCRHTNPHKLKFVFVVCENLDDIGYMGFLVNSKVNRYISKRPHLLECQVVLSKADYHFLFNDSYLDCARMYPFRHSELVVGLGSVNDKTKLEIRAAVFKAKTIEKRYKDLILDV